MSLVCIASEGESPGATTTALLLATLWPKPTRQRLVVEADPSGGTLASTYQLSLHPNLASLANAVDSGVAKKRLWRTSQLLPGSVEAIVGPSKAEDSKEVLTSHGEQLGIWLNRLPRIDVFADVGQLSDGSPAADFVRCASLLLVVARPHLEQLERSAEQMEQLSASGTKVGWLLVGDQPYGAKEVEALFDYPVFGVLADDPQTADAIGQGLSVTPLTEAPLVQSATRVVKRVEETLAGTGPKRVRLAKTTDIPGKRASEAWSIERPPSLISVPAPEGGDADESQPTEVSTAPDDQPSSLHDEMAASATVPSVAPAKFWESTTRLAAPAQELSAATAKSDAAQPEEVNPVEEGSGEPGLDHTVAGGVSSAEMSITEVIGTVDAPTGEIDVPPSLISPETSNEIEVPPSVFSAKELVDTDVTASLDDGGIRPPSLLEAKLSTSANTAEELPGYPPLP